MNPTVTPVVSSDARLNRIQRSSLGIGVIALLICLVAAFIDAKSFFLSYLIAYVFWVSLALGSLGVVMLHNLAGGRWGAIIRRFLESGMQTLPIMAVLVIPILLGIPFLYEWSHQEALAHDAVLRHKETYLNPAFFIVRTVLYFAIWIGISLLLARRSSIGPASPALKGISAVGIIVFAFSVTFASVDWIMSLEPHWFSTIYGAIFLVGQALQTLAFCTALLVYFSDHAPFAGRVEPAWYHDLGNLILAFTCLWAYTSFSQFLIIWSGNIPEETPWYLRRTAGGWQAVSVLLVVFHFAVPFAVLLSRRVKRRGKSLARICAAIIVMRLVDLVYWIGPATPGGAFPLGWMSMVALVGVGGVWLWMFLRQLKRGPLAYMEDPRLAPEGGHH
jgi:hypothetical protein